MQLWGMGQTTITVDETTLERFKELKQELDEAERGVPDHTANSFLECLLDTYEAAEEGYYSDPSAEEIAEELQNTISMANEPGVKLDVGEIARDIEKLKELVERVPEETVDQMERRL